MKWLFVLLASSSFFCSLPVCSSLPEAIVFDYGGVIAHADSKPLLQFLSQSLNIPYSKIQRDFSYDKLQPALSAPISFWECYAGRKLDAKWIEEFDRHRDQIIVHVKGMQTLVLTLKQMGYLTPLLSNTTCQRAEFLRAMGEYNLFRPVLLSCNLGVEKPSRKIYEILLSRLQIPPELCIFIDDKKKNIKGARKLGIDAILFTTTSQLKEELIKRGIELESPFGKAATKEKTH